MAGNVTNIDSDGKYDNGCYDSNAPSSQRSPTTSAIISGLTTCASDHGPEMSTSASIKIWDDDINIRNQTSVDGQPEDITTSPRMVSSTLPNPIRERMVSETLNAHSAVPR